MGKAIFATKLVGVLISREPWEKAHVLWFKDMGEKLKRPDISDWGMIYTQKEDYFKKVDEIMQLQYENLDNEQRTEKARELYFKYVLKYIEEFPKVINVNALEKLKKIKEKYSLALISTSSRNIIDNLLERCNLTNFFDIVHTGNLTNKDNKEDTYNEFVSKYGKPEYYVKTVEDLEKVKI